MGATQLASLLFGVTYLALGLVFLYLWWQVLRRPYVLLIALARLLAVPDVRLRLLVFQSPDAPVLRVLAATLSAASAVCLTAGLPHPLRRKARAWPFPGLALAVVWWG